MPSVSVIVPIYNVEPYIAQCVRSLFGQTLKDIEFIFIDDCSPDRSMAILQEVLEEFPERKPQVKCLRMEKNSGQAKVRLHGISLATGEYVIHCDSDDYVDRKMYETMYTEASSHNLDIVSCDYLVGDGETWARHIISSKQGHELSDILTGRSTYSLCTRLMRRSLLKDIIAPVSNMGEDMMITVQASCRAKRIGHVPQALYYYRRHYSSITKAQGEEAHLARWNATKANTELLLDVLIKQYSFSEKDPEIIFTKYNCRYWLEPIVHIPKYYHLWKNTFPEIDGRFLFTPRIKTEVKIWYILIRMRVYSPIKRITRKLRKL